MLPVAQPHMVNRAFGEPAMPSHERHDAGDLETKTQGRLAAE
ncbi:hypothetical protein [Mesorhizobium norvegicum]